MIVLLVVLAIVAVVGVWLSIRYGKKESERWTRENPIPDRPLLQMSDLILVDRLDGEYATLPEIHAPGGCQRGLYCIRDGELKAIETIPFEVSDVIAYLRRHGRLR